MLGRSLVLFVLLLGLLPANVFSAEAAATGEKSLIRKSL